MRAWMNAELALASRPHEDWCAVLKGNEDAECDCGRNKSVVAAVEIAIGQAQTIDARRVLGKYYARVPAAVRPLLGRRGEAGLKLLLGRWVKYDRDEEEQLAQAVLAGREINAETGWIAGLAGLTEREADAYWRRIRGTSRLEIARELTPAEHRHDRSRWVALKTVSNLCWQAKLRVLKAFGLPQTGDVDEDWDGESDGEV